jgi:hypothetical protein
MSLKPEVGWQRCRAPFLRAAGAQVMFENKNKK